MDTNCIHTGDSFEVLDSLEANSVHAIVTDPPYALGDSGFMGRDWDHFSDSKAYQKWCEQWASECNRVLKPGGHLLGFGGNTRHHRLFSGVEDAGFEIRDTITWHYGSGFPKALDVSKAIQKQNGVEPEQVDDASGVGFMNSDDDGWNKTHNQIQMPEPTGEAKQWDGFKTALKPATEYVVVARKPFDSTVAENMQTHGTGALNIGATRIETGDETPSGSGKPAKSEFGEDGWGNGGKGFVTPDAGRYPSNVIFDETQAQALDDEVGELGESKGVRGEGESQIYGGGEGYHATFEDGKFGQDIGYLDSGGPSRYFYTSKASKAERTLNGSIDNSHPTVKPIDLMEYLIKLVTAENQIILDPFCGSGTTCKAAKNLNRRFIGIEKQAKWADVARVRCGLTPDDPSVVRSDENQAGLESF